MWGVVAIAVSTSVVEQEVAAHFPKVRHVLGDPVAIARIAVEQHHAAFDRRIIGKVPAGQLNICPVYGDVLRLRVTLFREGAELQALLRFCKRFGISVQQHAGKVPAACRIDER